MDAMPNFQIPAMVMLTKHGQTGIFIVSMEIIARGIWRSIPAPDPPKPALSFSDRVSLIEEGHMRIFIPYPLYFFTGKEVITMGFFSKLFGKSEKAPAFDGNKLYAPLNGQAVPVTEVPDPTFAEGLLGNGIAIIPSDGKVCSPVDGTIETMFDTGHAVCLKSSTGVEILIHVGLETVGLNGAPFKVHCKDGDTVKKGQLLFEADLAAIQAAGLPIITPVLVCNTDDYPTFEVVTGKTVTNDDIVISVAK